MDVTEVSAHLGRRLRVLRERDGLRREDIVQRAVRIGLPWQTSVLASIEQGQRQIGVGEFLLLPALYGGTLGEILAEDKDEVELVPGVHIDGAALRRLLTARYTAGAEMAHPDVSDLTVRNPGIAPFAPPVLDADKKAAIRLGIAPEEVLDASLRLWGKSLSARRDEVTAAEMESRGVDLSGRALQTLRGHVTRGLLAELRASLPSRVAAG